MPQTPVAGTTTKQSGQRMSGRSGMIGAAALRGAAAREEGARSDDDAPAIGGDDARERVEDGRFSAAVRSEQGERLPRRDV